MPEELEPLLDLLEKETRSNPGSILALPSFLKQLGGRMTLLNERMKISTEQ